MSRDTDLDEELRAHLAMAVADRVARGESPEEAVAAARREFGNVTHVKEVTRETWGGAWLERLVQDLRYAIRSLRRSPSFTIVAVLTLALGIGVNSAMFTVMNGILLQPLPFPDPERVVAVSYQNPGNHWDGALSDHHYVALRDGAAPRIFSHLATYREDNNSTLRSGGEPIKVLSAQTTPDFFAVFGVRAAIGRTFDRDEPVVVLSDRLWRTRFGADSAIVGRSIGIDSLKRTVIGVMPAALDVPTGADLWIPWTIVTHPDRTWNHSVVGRVRADLSVDQARSIWTTAAASLVLDPDDSRISSGVARADLIPLKSLIVGDARRPLLVFAGAVAFVLLIACANVANLLLMRFASRDREMAVRAALGAGRRRLIRQLLTETLVISSVGAVLGVAVAGAAVKLVVAIAPPEMLPRVANVHLDGTVLLFTAVLVLATTAVCGIVPALQSTDVTLRPQNTRGAGRGRLRSTLVVAEIAMALVLLVGAGLMLRSFQRMQRVDLGFDGSNRLTMHVSLPDDRYRTGAAIKDFHARVMRDLALLPGANDVAAINWLPFTRMMIDGPVSIEGGTKLDFTAGRMVVTPRYFAAMGQPILRGRAFTDADRIGAPRVVIVSKSIADRMGENVVGKRIALGETPAAEDWVTVVGVVNDVVQNNVTDHADPAVYQAMSQEDFPFFLANTHYIVRASNDHAALALGIRRVVRNADPALAVESVRELSDLVQGTMLTPRFQARVLAAFALLALTLAMIGIYGVLAYGVTQRYQEIGVRVALGATARDVRGLVLRRTAGLAFVGLSIGVLASLGVTRVLSKFLFQITPTDPPTFAAVVLLLGSVALAAAYLPARRASRVDPLIALRRE